MLPAGVHGLGHISFKKELELTAFHYLFVFGETDKRVLYDSPTVITSKIEA